ncbi:Acyl-CoA-binding domain-containing protein 5 [Wickerhamomyces ciferrii]|uniref:Acyl-CoA-binding domain-containing protein 5 n=1 Tax=Wickerhamomyces ciferrii (strain ATCC 14091 / BCRC 22168 / CBS 111 / JCM 3599 / NBRC 0793 / NRRL Y-1031 F-60-10) TaxID=1206466 RepID=K0KWA2_WICCF|nr:Acyl-CoA-binding domain-containing protein 5 [Wickerhamomyces ciferrii]CCH46252.1 Acyl-CoA-binding domain-containing protein 5 [Wickerhamomyces ciferrii]
MSDSIDRVFVKAISTIRALSTRSGYGSLPRPPVENRIRLYGLYKQATGFNQEDESARRKYDAWKSEEGISKTEAKRRYIAFLIETMRTYASGTHEARELLNELEYLWDQIKEIIPSPSPPLTPLHTFPSNVAIAGGNGGSLTGSLYGDSFLMDDRSAILGYHSNKSELNLSKDVAILKKEVGLALRRINNELNQINQARFNTNGGNNGSNYDDENDDNLWRGYKIIRKLTKFLFKFLGNVLKRLIIDLVILISIIKFIRYKNGLDVNLSTTNSTNNGIINRFLFGIFKLLNKVNLVNFNRLYIEID